MNIYLEKIAATRLAKELAEGNVSVDPLVLAKRKFLRNPEAYEKGMKKGTSNILDSVNADVSKPNPSSGVGEHLTPGSGGYFTSTGKDGKIHVLNAREHSSVHGLNPKSGEPYSRQLDGLVHQQNIRHESHEAQAIRRALTEGGKVDPQKTIDYLNHVDMYQDRYNVDPKKLNPIRRFLKAMQIIVPSAIIHKNGEKVGAHQDLVVLARESNSNRLNPYLKHIGLTPIRKATGEAALIEKITGKRFGVDKMTKTDFRKLEKKEPTGLSNRGYYHEVEA